MHSACRFQCRMNIQRALKDVSRNELVGCWAMGVDNNAEGWVCSTLGLGHKSRSFERSLSGIGWASKVEVVRVIVHWYRGCQATIVGADNDYDCWRLLVGRVQCACGCWQIGQVPLSHLIESSSQNSPGPGQSTNMVFNPPYAYTWPLGPSRPHEMWHWR